MDGNMCHCLFHFKLYESRATMPLSASYHLTSSQPWGSNRSTSTFKGRSIQKMKCVFFLIFRLFACGRIPFISPGKLQTYNTPASFSRRLLACVVPSDSQYLDLKSFCFYLQHRLCLCAWVFEINLFFLLRPLREIDLIDEDPISPELYSP